LKYCCPKRLFFIVLGFCSRDQHYGCEAIFCDFHRPFAFRRVLDRSRVPVSEKTKDQVLEQYVATLDNAQRVHQLGFQATVIFDFDADKITHPTPLIYRRYGMVADVANGKLRRIENVGWTIGDTGTKWEQGARLIVNDVGAFFQEDPSAISKIDKAKVTPNFWVNAQAMYSPFGLLWSTHNGAGQGLATPDAIKILESESQLIDVRIKESRTECLYLANNNVGALLVVYDKDQGGMASEVQLFRHDSDPKIPVTRDPKEIYRWQKMSLGKVYWNKIVDTKQQVFWVPAIVETKEEDPGNSERMIHYFVDWKIGKDVDMAIFDHKKFEKEKPNTIYAEVELSHEYIARQKELDEKALALRKKFKLE
jgi:hypothetical protein